MCFQLSLRYLFIYLFLCVFFQVKLIGLLIESELEYKLIGLEI